MNVVMELAHEYRESWQLPADDTDYSTIVALPASVTSPFVAAYLAHDPDSLMSEDAFSAYDQLIWEIKLQWRFLQMHGFTFDVVDHDPYVTKSGAPNSLAMRRDVIENLHISVLSTAVTGTHPFFTDAENDLFRAVHDIFGHAATERNFAADGEEAAYQHHRTMFWGSAIDALTTETRVQNSLNNSNDNAFVAQRCVIIPEASLV